VWAHLLAAFGFAARGGCVSGIYMPLIENMKPTEAAFFDPDGVQSFIYVGLHGWKKRHKRRLQTIYYIKLHRNYVNPQYCPVTWLLLHLKTQGKLTGPLFAGKDGAAISSAVWKAMLSRWFHLAGLEGKTSHSIRAGAIQSAGRQGAKLWEILAMSRSSCVQRAIVYFQEGAALGQAAKRAVHGGRSYDPIYDITVWKPCVDNQVALTEFSRSWDPSIRPDMSLDL
jgi:hypothetical protein